LESLLTDGKVRAIGVSNFMVEHLTKLLDHATVVPAVNQIEVHPYFAQHDDPTIGAVAKSHHKTPAQVMLRWGIQHGRSVIPKPTKPARIAENLNVFDFELTADQMTAIDRLDTGQRGGPDPDAITLESFGREIPDA
jgi:diketogulonate reductase-like aldo/keto reductase